MNKELAELVGILIGDGYIYCKNNHYQVGVVGHPVTDKEYFEKIRRLIRKVWNKEVKIRERFRGLRLTFSSKSIVMELINDIGLPYGHGKGKKVTIPTKIFNDWNLARHTIRGIVDTDGSIFTSNKPGSPNYPSIEITTTSKELALQLKSLLTNKGFRVANIWSYQSKLGTCPTYRVPLNGYKNVEMWLNEIGFTNPYKLNRAKEIINRKNGTTGIFILSNRV